MVEIDPQPVTRTGPHAWQYGWWTVVGGVLGLAVAGAATIGVFLAPLALVLALVGAAIPSLRNRSAVAVVAGLGIAPLYIAWLNRDGPGTVCRSPTPLSESCAEEWSPWPFAVVGIVLVVVGIALARRRRVPPAG